MKWSVKKAFKVIQTLLFNISDFTVIYNIKWSNTVEIQFFVSGLTDSYQIVNQHCTTGLGSTTKLTMQAVLQTSAGVLYPAPISTSKALYCLVWMSSVKCLCCRRRNVLQLEAKEVFLWLVRSVSLISSF